MACWSKIDYIWCMEQWRYHHSHCLSLEEMNQGMFYLSIGVYRMAMDTEYDLGISNRLRRIADNFTTTASEI
jgi:hypothetical protein